jgi:hypothetical protein
MSRSLDFAVPVHPHTTMAPLVLLCLPVLSKSFHFSIDFFLTDPFAEFFSRKLYLRESVMVCAYIWHVCKYAIPNTYGDATLADEARSREARVSGGVR